MFDFDKALTTELTSGAMLCPRCTQHIIVPGTVAGDRYGVCEPCYLRALRDAKVTELVILDAKREYDAVRQDLHRTKKKLGITTGRIKNSEPEF